MQSGHVNQAVITLENHCERIGITGLKVPHYALIIEHEEFGIRRVVVAIAGANSWKTHGYVAAPIYHMNGREITQENYFLEWDRMRFQAVYNRWECGRRLADLAFQTASGK